MRELKAAQQSNSYYFIGPVIVAREGLAGPFDVIDGQQRIMTLSAILAMLRDLLPPGDFKNDLQKRLTRGSDSIARVSEMPRILTQESNREEYQKVVHQVSGTLQLNTRGGTLGPLARAIARMKTDFGDPAREYIEGVARYLLEDMRSNERGPSFVKLGPTKHA